ncbi:50S ribosomal protein L19 [bioreactor metagenome]
MAAFFGGCVGRRGEAEKDERSSGGRAFPKARTRSKTGALGRDIFAGLPQATKGHAMNLIAQLEAEQIAALGKTIPDFKAGDTVRVGFKVTEGTRTRVQMYEGVCIARKGGSTLAASFTVRKISFGEGVERVFPLYSTNIDSIEVVRRGRVRRAKLYYLRDRRGKSARIAEDTTYKAKA